MQTWHRKIQSYSKPNKTADTQSERTVKDCVYALAYACDLSVNGNMCVLHMLLIFYSKAKTTSTTTTKNYGIEGVKPYPNPFYASDFQYFVSGCCATAALWCDIPPMVQFFPSITGYEYHQHIYSLSLPFHTIAMFMAFDFGAMFDWHTAQLHILYGNSKACVCLWHVLWVNSHLKREASKLNILEYTLCNVTIV